MTQNVLPTTASPYPVPPNSPEPVVISNRAKAKSVGVLSLSGRPNWISDMFKNNGSGTSTGGGNKNAAVKLSSDVSEPLPTQLADQELPLPDEAEQFPVVDFVVDVVLANEVSESTVKHGSDKGEFLFPLMFTMV
jgi:hypothetical protein